MANSNLSAAKKAKNDEFYTQLPDIEREMNAYLEYDPDVFRDKTVLLPCDDPEWSNFTRYFSGRFDELGLKKLISTSYAPRSNAAIDESQHVVPASEQQDSRYDPEKAVARGKKYVLDGNDLNADGKVDFDDLQWEYLEGDGDFRSAEVTALRDEADIVITNGPFSLFREFLNWLVEGDVLFSMIGNKNAITYKEVFPLIRDNQMWIGATGNTSDMVFAVPPGAEVRESDRAKAARMGYVGDYTRMGNACWYTNIQHGRRHEPLKLMTMADNLIHCRVKKVREQGYLVYDNYDAIEVPATVGIPSDYDGVMGVPISFLDKHSPEQFEIIGMAKRGAGDPALKTRVYTAEDYSNYSDLNAGPVIIENGTPRNTYPRILIRHRNPEQPTVSTPMTP